MSPQMLIHSTPFDRCCSVDTTVEFMCDKHFEHLANVCLLGTFFLFLQESGMQNIAALLPVLSDMAGFWKTSEV